MIDSVIGFFTPAAPWTREQRALCADARVATGSRGSWTFQLGCDRARALSSAEHHLHDTWLFLIVLCWAYDWHLTLTEVPCRQNISVNLHLCALYGNEEIKVIVMGSTGDL